MKKEHKYIFTKPGNVEGHFGYQARRFHHHKWIPELVTAICVKKMNKNIENEISVCNR